MFKNCTWCCITIVFLSIVFELLFWCPSRRLNISLNCSQISGNFIILKLASGMPQLIWYQKCDVNNMRSDRVLLTSVSFQLEVSCQKFLQCLHSTTDLMLFCSGMPAIPDLTSYIWTQLTSDIMTSLCIFGTVHIYQIERILNVGKAPLSAIIVSGKEGIFCFNWSYAIHFLFCYLRGILLKMSVFCEKIDP